MTTKSLYSPVIDAMRLDKSDSSTWTLADALLKAVPANSGKGDATFTAIIADADAAGIAGYSVTTLRQYRDQANVWPADKRVDGISFSAHAEVSKLKGASVDEKHRVLEDAKANKATVASIRQDIRFRNNPNAKPLAAAKAKSVDVSDLLKGGSKLIAAIKAAGLSDGQLDKVHDGLTAVLTEVDAMRAKAAAKAAKAAAKKSTGSARKAPRPVVESAPAADAVSVPASTDGVVAGDLSNL